MSPARRVFTSQLGTPRGFFGKQAAREMGIVNGRMIAFAIDLLHVEPGNRVLEIGFGGGKSLGELATRAAGGRVTGVDHSETMVEVAKKRHRRAVRNGTIEIHHASVERLPVASASTDRVLTVNSLPYWGDVAGGIAEIVRVMVPGARAVIAVRPPEGMRRVGVAGEGITLLDDDGLRAAAERAGLDVVEIAGAADKLGGSRHLVATKG